MTRHVAMLRGINVGGKNLIAMPALREALAESGLADVTTYIQSGNALFDAPGMTEAAVVTRVERVILDRFGLTVPTVARSASELRRIAEAHPFYAPDVDVTTLAVIFLTDVPSGEAVASLDPERSPPDVWRVSGREIALFCPNGFGRTKLTIDYFERRLGIRATARNWRTVQTLAAMLS